MKMVLLTQSSQTCVPRRKRKRNCDARFDDVSRDGGKGDFFRSYVRGEMDELGRWTWVVVVVVFSLVFV